MVNHRNTPLSQLSLTKQLSVEERGQLQGLALQFSIHVKFFHFAMYGVAVVFPDVGMFVHSARYRASWVAYCVAYV